MPNSIQEFLANFTQKSAADLEAALLRLPEDKWAWSPSETARTALNQMAEIAILNGYTANVLESGIWSSTGMENYMQERDDAAKDWATLSVLLKQNTERAIAAIRNVPDDKLSVEIETQFGPMTWSQIMSYPSWNMCYHEGQINYIASILGCL